MCGSLPLALIAFNTLAAQITGRAPAGSRVSIPQLGRHAIADDSGRFRFDSVSDGRWGVEAHTPTGIALALADVRNGSASVRFTTPRDCGGGDTTRAREGSITASLVMRPAEPVPGTLVTLFVSGDSIRHIEGHVAGEPVMFRRDTGNTFVTLAAVPLDSGPLIHAALRYRRLSGEIIRHDTALTVSVPPAAVVAAAPREHLRVAAQFSKPQTSNVTLRIAGESELARAVGVIAMATPPLWSQPFMRPRASRITSGFNSGRQFNGTLNSRHTGVDFRGAVGDTVQATNRGVVALVADFYLAGTVVYIVHGAGLASGYFHLSATNVAIGDTVERGQVIGRVGQSGRVTGPHLHWIIRYDHTTVDPMGVLSLPWVPREIDRTCRGSD
jgi:murein DD-endopeptidase MepM/ murein hydrolase activator NlpD